MHKIINLLREPSTLDIDVDSLDRLSIHRRILKRKKLLRNVFRDFHHQFMKLDNKYFSGDGLKIELGSGIAPVRDTYPEVLATDMVYTSSLDQILDAQDMNLADNSVRAMFAQNCFHHFPDPKIFFSELNRVLKPGAGIVLIEPYYGPLASFVFKNLFKTEGFDKDFPSWKTPTSGPMNGANQALSYIVFIRDRKDFECSHPSLEIVHHECCRNYLKYLLSGGLNFRQLLPNFTEGIINIFQFFLSPFNKWLSLHHVIVIRKKI